ncbi:sugar-binding transcriptional regulator [Paenibacillus tarimensis]|uniref:sugar-binding transcriptional regulator n=1 Tax=Paenibacillus tarimensis TaxID=416012 RepID=UPI001F1BF334|nr:sugar-binding domain-containing protein [Paenibacillus tarimensis]MCF2945673.1 sugar-binding domain-containing protein [Paenibacillus tarimensis]
MRPFIELQQQLVPDLLYVMKKRYAILSRILSSDVVGRRALATSLSMTERVLRAETDFLKAQGLLESNASGMRITEAGRQLVEALDPLVKDLFGLSELEGRIKAYYGLEQVIIVPGDSDTSPQAKRELGRAGAHTLQRFLKPDDVVAVTGGSTLAAMAGQMSAAPQLRGVQFVPARGGLGESLDYQANTIASALAKQVGAGYRLLHVPDHLSEEAYNSLMQEPNVREVVGVIRRARIVIHGIGDAIVMARRRKVDQKTIDEIRSEGALAEALGYYFDRSGSVIHRMSTVGLRIDDLSSADKVIAVAGGSSKGEAIAAVLLFGQADVLVTDEGAARQLEYIINRDQIAERHE